MLLFLSPGWERKLPWLWLRFIIYYGLILTRWAIDLTAGGWSSPWLNAKQPRHRLPTCRHLCFDESVRPSRNLSALVGIECSIFKSASRVFFSFFFPHLLRVCNRKWVNGMKFLDIMDTNSYFLKLGLRASWGKILSQVRLLSVKQLYYSSYL